MTKSMLIRMAKTAYDETVNSLLRLADNQSSPDKLLPPIADQLRCYYLYQSQGQFQAYADICQLMYKDTGDVGWQKLRQWVRSFNSKIGDQHYKITLESWNVSPAR